MRYKGFTLVGVLVLLISIVLLLYFLFYFFDRNSEFPRQAACKSNLNGIGMAIAIYRTEKDDQWPLLTDDGDYTQSAGNQTQSDTIWDENGKSNIGQGAMQNTWILIAYGVIGENIFHCPYDNAWVERKYGAPKYGWGNDNEYSYGMYAPYAKFKGKDNPAALNETTKGSMVIMSDQNKGTLTNFKKYQERSGIAPANHKKDGISYLRVDGSVQWFKWPDCKTDGVPVGPGNDNIFTTQHPTNIHLPANAKDSYIVPKP